MNPMNQVKTGGELISNETKRMIVTLILKITGVWLTLMVVIQPSIQSCHTMGTMSTFPIHYNSKLYHVLIIHVHSPPHKPPSTPRKTPFFFAKNSTHFMWTNNNYYCNSIAFFIIIIKRKLIQSIISFVLTTNNHRFIISFTSNLE